MSIAGALATLLDVVERDSKTRCAEILGAAQAEAAALRADAMAEGRRRLRAALRAERAAVAAAEALLPDALQTVWADPPRRRKWLEHALSRAAQTLPRDAWRIRHAPTLGADDKAWLQQRLGELGVAGASFEADPEIHAGIEIQAGAARLEATPTGLLADRAWVYGRLLHLVYMP